MNQRESALPVMLFLQVLNRKRKVFAVSALLIFAAVILLFVTRTRTYDATVTFEFQKEGAGALNLDSLMGGMSGGSSGVLGENVDMQTQSTILQTDTIEMRVIDDLHLEGTKDFKPKFSLLGTVLGWVTPHDPVVATTSDTLEGSPIRRMLALQVFKKNVHVAVIAGRHLVPVTYTSTNPELAANVANDLVHRLVEYSFETKFTATNEVSTWLEHQLGDLRKQSEDLQAQVVALQKTTGLYGVSGVGLNDKPSVYSPVLEQLQQATMAYSSAQENAVMKASIYKTVESGDADLISQLSGTGTVASASQGVTSTLTLIQNLRSQEASLEAQIAQDAVKFGAAYPRLVEERASLARVQQSLREEIGRVQARAKNDYEIARRQLEGSEKAYFATRAEASKLNDRTIE